jgi:hypothetical protein
MGVAMAITSGVVIVPVGLLLLAVRLPRAWRARQMGKAGAECGLRARAGLSKTERAELEELILFRFAGRGTLSSASWALAGRVGDCPVLVFDIGYLLSFSTPSGVTRYLRAVQTVAVMRGLEVHAHFHCGPRMSLWDRREPGWPHQYGLHVSRTVCDPDGEPRAVLHTSLDAAVGGLPAAFVDELARLGSRTVQGAPGVVVVYQDDRLIEPAEMHLLLEGVRRLAVALAPHGRA